MIECLVQCFGEVCCGACSEVLPDITPHKKWEVAAVRIFCSLLLLGTLAAIVAGIVLLSIPSRNVDAGIASLSVGLFVLLLFVVLFCIVGKERKKRLRALRSQTDLQGNRYREGVCRDGDCTVSLSENERSEQGGDGATEESIPEDGVEIPPHGDSFSEQEK